MMGGGTKTTTTSTAAQPWVGAQPALKTAIGDAQNLYKTGGAFQPYTGSTVVPFSAPTMQGMRGITNQSNNVVPGLTNNFTALQAINGAGGLTGTQRGSLDGMAVASRQDPAGTAKGYGDIARNPYRSEAVSAIGALQRIGANPNGITTGDQYGHMAGDGGIKTGGAYTRMADRGSINTGDKYQSLWNKGGRGSNAQSNLADYANGSFLDGRNNPAFNDVLKRAQESAQGAVDMGAAASGRYGSAVHQGNVAREVGDTTARALAGQYNTEVGNMMNANQMMDQQRLANLDVQGQAAAGLTGVQDRNFNNRLGALDRLTSAQNQSFQNRLSALAGQTGVQGQNIANRMGAANSVIGASQNAVNQQLSALGGQSNAQLANAQFQQGARRDAFNAGQTGLQNRMNAMASMPGAYQAMLQPFQAQMGLGSMYEDLAGRTMNDQLRLFNEQRNAPRQNIEWLNAIASGAGQLGGTSQTMASEPKPSPFAAGLNGAVSGYSQTRSPWGALAGGLGGVFS